VSRSLTRTACGPTYTVGVMPVALDLEIVPLPLRKDSDGYVRVGGTRVGLDAIVDAFLEGCSCEEIALQYPGVALPDIYATVTFYLHHRIEVDAYIASERAANDEVRLECERRWSPQELRERLLRRSRG
jgi:uncharacterized protein (DUF433 family)